VNGDLRASQRPVRSAGLEFLAQGLPVREMVAHAIASRKLASRGSVVTYTRDGDAYAVAASKSGMPTNPAWFANLVAHPTFTIEAEGKTTEATAVVAEGADRDELWDRHVQAHPEFASYPEKTGGRVIPMIRLTPIR
jgi:deazaflavin-dependent oxidoreductase (nitroreductase family)